jgi:hypothetical protein
MDAKASEDWADRVTVNGVRTFFYLQVSLMHPALVSMKKRRENITLVHQQNEFFKEHLQPMIMPTMLVEGIVKPN